MADVRIEPRNHTGGNNDDFVGMQFESKDGAAVVRAIFPHGYKHSGKENQPALKKELFSLLSTINRYSRNAGQDLFKARGQTIDFPFDAYITIIRAFMQYGYYIESETKHKKAVMGKISWKRTIEAVKPLIKDNSPIYIDFVIRKNEKKTDKLISLIHEWCVFEAFHKLGWIFTVFKPHKPRLQVKSENKSYYISIIQDLLKETFNDRNRSLFNAMIAMLKLARAEDKNTFFFGTTHFHTIWENLVDLTYGISDKQKREYFPPAKWNFIWGKTKTNLLLPDTIMLTDDDTEIFVLDAKYYSFVWNFSVPAAADINKQITYGEFAHAQKKKTVYNAFIMPYDFESDPHGLMKNEAADDYGYIGYAVLETKTGIKTHEKVLGILIDTRQLLDNVGNFSKNGLAKFIKDRYRMIWE